MASTQAQHLLEGPVGVLLTPFGAMYGLGARLRVAAYRKGLRRSHRPPMPTLSIGNISAGGTGKTPLLFAALRYLEEHQITAGVLSRGYGGDEGRILEERHPETLLAEDPDRVRALQQFLTLGAPDILLLDDGFQHLRLQRDIDVVVVDAMRPFGRCLPAGLFREPTSALRRADLVVLSRVDLVPPDERERIWRIVDEARRDLPSLPRLEGTVQATEARNLQTGAACTPEEMRGAKALVTAGIGNPASFLELCHRMGVHVLEARFQRDHHDWSERDKEDWHRFEHVLVTEKDGVKLRAAAPDHVWEIRVDWHFTRGEDHWREMLDRLILPVRAARIEPLWTAHDPSGKAVT